ncbi:hypothetical protein ACWA2C_28090 [Priestia megaterium]
MSYMRTNKRENPYVQVDKTFIEDDSLSWGAKGLMAYILSRPDNWKIRRTDLEKRSTDKRDKVENYIYELMAAGYIYYFALRKEDNTIDEWVYEVYESPEFNDHLEESIAKGKEMIQKKKDRNKKKTAKRKETKKGPDVEVPHEGKNPKSPDVEIPHEEVPHEEIPHYNKNDLTKNDFNKTKDIKDLSIHEDINESDLPVVLKKLLSVKIDRLISLNISVLNIVTNYKLNKDKVSEGQYISALEYALGLTHFTKSFKDVMAANIKKQLQFAKEDAEVQGSGSGKKKIVRKEMVPEWLNGNEHKDAPKEENAQSHDPLLEEAELLLDMQPHNLKPKHFKVLNQAGLWNEAAQAAFEKQAAELKAKLQKNEKAVVTN